MKIKIDFYGELVNFGYLTESSIFNANQLTFISCEKSEVQQIFLIPIIINRYRLPTFMSMCPLIAITNFANRKFWRIDSKFFFNLRISLSLECILINSTYCDLIRNVATFCSYFCKFQLSGSAANICLTNKQQNLKDQR